MNKVGETVKEILLQSKISQQELCDATGISKSAMSKYLTGDKLPRTEIVVKIAKALNISLYTLLGEDGKEVDTYMTCKTALLARGGTCLSDKEKKELINLILEK